jgi:hypothetical protein
MSGRNLSSSIERSVAARRNPTSASVDAVPTRRHVCWASAPKMRRGIDRSTLCCGRSIRRPTRRRLRSRLFPGYRQVTRDFPNL